MPSQVTMMDQERDPAQRDSSWLARLRVAIGRLDVLIGMLLAVLLLPLIIGPFVVAYEFARSGAYIDAVVVASVFAAAITAAVRAVRRQEFSPGTIICVLAFAAVVLFMATRLHR